MSKFANLEVWSFGHILQVQKGVMESKVVFFIAQILKFFFKDGFLLLFFILPLTTTQIISEGVQEAVLDNSVAVTVVLTVLSFSLVGLWALNIQIDSPTLKTFFLLLPWVDVVAFPVITLSLIVISSGNSGLTLFTIIVIIIVTSVQLIFNLVNFSKAPKGNNLFQCRENRFSLTAHILLLVLCFYLVSRWTNRSPFSQQELIVCSILHLLLSVIKFSTLLSIQSKESQ